MRSATCWLLFGLPVSHASTAPPFLSLLLHSATTLPLTFSSMSALERRPAEPFDADDDEERNSDATQTRMAATTASELSPAGAFKARRVPVALVQVVVLVVTANGGGGDGATGGSALLCLLCRLSSSRLRCFRFRLLFLPSFRFSSCPPPVQLL